MKFLGGFITGVVATIIVLFLIWAVSDDGTTISTPVDATSTIRGLTMLPEEGECMFRGEIEIFQTLRPNLALARQGRFPNESLFLLIGNENDFFYDEKRIVIPANKCARQIGIYQYETRAGG